MLHKIYDSLLTIAYPQPCKICGASVENSRDGVACESCWSRTRIFLGAETACQKCQRLLKEYPTDIVTNCHQCSEHFYNTARSVGAYEHALMVTVLRLKHAPVIPKRIENCLLELVSGIQFNRIDCVVPVPLSKRRFIARGFNQSSVLAKLITKRTKTDLVENSLIRTKHSKTHRAGMDKKGRMLSIKGAFQLNGKHFVAKDVLLVDDVFTSGATVSECARVLKKGGANRVSVITIARAV